MLPGYGVKGENYHMKITYTNNEIRACNIQIMIHDFNTLVTFKQAINVPHQILPNRGFV